MLGPHMSGCGWGAQRCKRGRRPISLDRADDRVYGYTKKRHQSRNSVWGMARDVRWRPCCQISHLGLERDRDANAHHTPGVKRKRNQDFPLITTIQWPETSMHTWSSWTSSLLRSLVLDDHTGVMVCGCNPLQSHSVMSALSGPNVRKSRNGERNDREVSQRLCRAIALGSSDSVTPSLISPPQL